MLSQPRRARRALFLVPCRLVLGSPSLPSWAAEKMRLRVDDYQIDAELTPHTHKITARAKVKFTALEDTNVATFRTAQRTTRHQGHGRGEQATERGARHPRLDGPSATGDSSHQGQFDYSHFRI